MRLLSFITTWHTPFQVYYEYMHVNFGRSCHIQQVAVINAARLSTGLGFHFVFIVSLHLQRDAR